MNEASWILDCGPHRDALAVLASGFGTHPKTDLEGFLGAAALRADRLPDAICATLRRFRLEGNRSGALLLERLPAADPAAAWDGEAWLALIGSRFGELIGYLQEKGGALFHDVTPNRSEEMEQSSGGSRVPLALHTERCFHPFLPDYVLLYCVRPDLERKGATTIVSVRDMLPLIAPGHLSILFEPVFRTGIDYSFGNLSTTQANGPVLSVLYGSRDDPYLRYDLDLMAGLTPAAAAALEAVRAAADAVTRSVCLEPRSLLIVDNRRAVHGRAAFTPRYDAADRLLKRAYVVSDLAPSAADREPRGRVIGTRFDNLA